jgi:hypothetical protein
MEITNHNFEEHLPAILATIARSTCIFIDCEFSGTRVVDSLYKTPQDGKTDQAVLWAKFAEAAKNYKILQLGLTCAWDEETEKRQPRREEPRRRRRSVTYSFIINPFLDVKDGSTAKLAQHLDRDVVLNDMTMRFLAENGLDFGRVLFDGVPYLSRPELDQLDKLVGEKTAELERIQKSIEEGSKISSGFKSGEAPEDVEFHESDSGSLVQYVRDWLAQNADEVKATPVACTHFHFLPSELTLDLQAWNELMIFPPDSQLATRAWTDRVLDHLRARFPDSIKALKDYEGYGVKVRRREMAKDAERLTQAIETLRAAKTRALGMGYVVFFLIDVLNGQPVDDTFTGHLRTFLGKFADSSRYMGFYPLVSLSDHGELAADHHDVVANSPDEFPTPEEWLDAALSCIRDMTRETKQVSLIGHNVSWDLAFLFSMFLGPLSPTDRTSALTSFPSLADRIYDTKVMAKRFDERFSGLDLPTLYSEVRKQADSLLPDGDGPETQWDIGFGYPLGDDCRALPAVGNPGQRIRWRSTEGLQELPRSPRHGAKPQRHRRDTDTQRLVCA